MVVNKKTALNISILFFFVCSTLVSAQGFTTKVSKPVRDFLCVIWDSLLYIGLAIAAVVIAVAGGNYVYNRDNPSGHKASISWIMHVIIGLLLLALAQTFVQLTSIPVVCD